MKTKKTLSALLLSFFFTLLLFAQNDHSPFCHQTPEAEAQIRERLIQNKKLLESHAIQRSVVTFVPVKIHLVGDDEGEGRISIDRALDMLCVLNVEFEDSDIQFYMKDGFSYVDSELIFEHTGFNNSNGSVLIWDASSAYKAEDAINIFVTNNVGGGNGNGVSLSYYSPFNDCLYIRKASALTASVLPHEMGHFFSLLHPFIGFETSSFCEGQADSIYCDMAETQSGSNCETTGDLICDTPPDYLFAFCPSTINCEFTGEVYDCEGTLVDPMENNMMSYYEGCFDYEFTEGQNEVMLTDLFSPERAYCNPGILPSSLTLASTTDLIQPDNDDFEIPFNTMHFQWGAVAGANHYLLEVDRFPNFDFDPYITITTTNEFVLTDYGQPNTTYYWRIRPFNEYRTCVYYSEIFAFETSNLASATNEIEIIQDWSINPNPVSTNERLVVEVTSNEAFYGEIKVQSISGKVMLEQKHNFAEGLRQVEISTNKFPRGVYLISIKTDEGYRTKKMVVE